ncbi:sn-glycerol-1-phosphate dehydrogenase [Halalkalibacterium halodurans]|uniref:Glycerol-1-phosphate dehydrogenase [NAD(P)+] n=1 Tax=Halalkalibacterium halodurans TaxID=86665 RepID=A0A0M0KJV8_ALKHA|nr:sn-glycerol-1-phosphate dehydrogenase [Halalkalibacterium halodurans]MDY7222421.1 sn-glycerol-1-phosphate dehydrogenase [Halalkalibacterium halodurans]MDY7241642.1 sn-glycerol-1-phosphate dehydrogenase [Halalkalibacterium halodurans]TPE70966.1 sn-glycerol-1-phosphate dehydrogenase [Halalkalibacterium halodurans]
MNHLLKQAKRVASECECGHEHQWIEMDELQLGRNAINYLPEYLHEKGLLHVTIVADANTYAVAGQLVAQLLRGRGIDVENCILKEQGALTLLADEHGLGQLVIGAAKETDVFLAVGAGTIHDLTRIASYKFGKPFIAIPTAPSVDGFTSMGAPVIRDGVKITFQTQAPIALFADLDFLTQAPRSMVAAGFGDMLGKSTSLVDWQVSHMLNDEPFCPAVFHMTKSALTMCMEHADEIAACNEQGIRLLTEALIMSGLAMLIFGHSHPASGAEHHLSHYWEMAFLRSGGTQPLHGAKVGYATMLISALYKNEARKKIETFQGEGSPLVNSIHKHRERLLMLIDTIPESSDIQRLLESVGGAVKSADLALADSLEDEALEKAHKLRERCTLLYCLNEHLKTS